MPAAIEIGVDLLVICALLVLIGLSKGLQYSLIAFLKWLGHRISSLHIPFTGIPIPGTGAVGGAIENAANWMYNQLAAGILAFEHSVTFFWHNLAELAVFLGEQIKGLAYDLLWLYHHIEKYTVPYWIGRLEKWLLDRLIAFAKHPIRYLRHAVAEIEHIVTRIPKIVHAVAGVAVEAPPWVGKRIGALEREVTALERSIPAWIRRAALAGIIGATALKVLERVAPWARCRNVRNAGRALCRMDAGLLDSLLADFLVIAGSLSLVQFAMECQRVTPPLESGLRRLIRELHGVP